MCNYLSALTVDDAEPPARVDAPFGVDADAVLVLGQFDPVRKEGIETGAGQVGRTLAHDRFLEKSKPSSYFFLNIRKQSKDVSEFHNNCAHYKPINSLTKPINSLTQKHRNLHFIQVKW